MTELWELVGPSWRLPVVIIWHDELGEINTSPVNLLTVQVQAIDKLLCGICFERADKLWVCRADLVQIAHRSDRTNPEDVVEWLPGRTALNAPPFPQNDFIEAYVASAYAITRDPTIADALWGSFCKFALHWVINEEKEFSIGFARIVPLLLRKNWANAAAKFEHRQRKVLLSAFLNPDIDSMLERGVADYLASQSVTACDEEKKIPRPTLEILPGPEFYEASMRRELARKRAWKLQGYWRRFFDRLKVQLPKVLEIYAEHLKEAKRPICAILRPHVAGGPHKRARSFYHYSPMEASGPWGEDDILFPPSKSAGETNSVHGQDGAMPDVPDLQSGTEDVRDGWHEIPEN